MDKQLAIVIRQYGDSVIADLINKLRGLDAVASGRLISSLNYKIQENINNIIIEFYGAQASDKDYSYADVIDKGFGAGHWIPIKPLLEWTRIKNLSEGAAYGIQQNIYKYGITPRPYIKEVLIRAQDESKIKVLEKAYKEHFRQRINELIKEVKLN